MSKELNLSTIFSDPWNPDTSLQLNNQFWPKERFQNLSILKESEDHFNNGRNEESIKCLQSYAAKLNFVDCHKILNYANLIKKKHSEFEIFRQHIDLENDISSNLVFSFPKDGFSEQYLNKEQSKNYEPIVSRLEKMHYRVFKEKANESVLHTKLVQANNMGKNLKSFDDFHYDLKMRLNCIYYLTDVKDEDGPFEYIENSTRIPYSTLLKAIHLYIFKDLSIYKKEEMSVLPLAFRGSLRCGEFIDAVKLNYLEPFCKKIIGHKGTCIFFNSHLLIHRGGVPFSGKRAILFIYLN